MFAFSWFAGRRGVIPLLLLGDAPDPPLAKVRTTIRKGLLLARLPGVNEEKGRPRNR